MYSTALENTAPALFFLTFRSKSLLGRARRPLGARNHCSDVLRSHLALEIAARPSLFPFDSTFVFPSKSFSKSLSFKLCPASSCVLCDVTGTVRCHMRRNYIVNSPLQSGRIEVKLFDSIRKHRTGAASSTERSKSPRKLDKTEKTRQNRENSRKPTKVEKTEKTRENQENPTKPRKL